MLDEVKPIRPENTIDGDLRYIMNEVNNIILDQNRDTLFVHATIVFEVIRDLMQDKYSFELELNELLAVLERFKLAGWIIDTLESKDSTNFYMNPRGVES